MEDLIHLDTYSSYVQYPITIFILLYSLISLKKFKLKDMYLILLIALFGVISYVIGLTKGFNVNPRAILLPIFFLITLRSNSYKLMKPLFIYCLLVTIIESTMWHMGISFWDTYERLGFNRPYGGFLDVHLNGIFLATSLYIFGHKYIGGIVSMITLSLQTPFAYSVVFINKKNIIYTFLFITILVYLLYAVGHVKTSNSGSMVNVYLSLEEYEFDNCFLLGCSSNTLHVKRTYLDKTASYYQGKHRHINDAGIVRFLFFFGIPWLIFYTLLVFRKSKSKIIPLIYFITLAHQPVAFGIISTCLLAISINYYNLNSPKRFAK